MHDSSYYTPAIAMAIACVLKGPAVLRAWRDPLLRSVYTLIVLSGLVFFFAAPPTISWVNRTVGIPNFSAALVYCLLSAFSASCLLLLLNWRGGPPEEARRAARRWVAGYAVVIVATMALFVLGHAPEERQRDFDTYYADTPYIREMILLYLAALAVANVAMIVMCWRWARQVRGWLRAGLLIIAVGFLTNITFAAAKLTAIVARWNGGDLDFLSSDLAPALAAAAELICAIGFCVPMACQRVGDVWSTWATYRRLGPLWRELQPADAHGDHAVRIAWWAPAELQVTQRESDIHDGLLNLYPYFDPEVRARAHDAAVAAGSGPDRARAEADAAMVTAALGARAADPEGRIICAATADSSPSAAPAGGPRDLVGMSVALRRSPVVATVRERAASEAATGSPERVA
ncbi:MAB_1171c family putative transporter [Streptomyces sp. NPDC088747]|uniref:MAB_1171c family putative transporter n=1 Tax=Streptomyces sp. NPDC088747 TaxID=3365886 RepID=UPI0038247C00